MSKGLESHANMDDLLAELDGLRGGRLELTEEQEQALLHARSGPNPVPWPALLKWWTDRGWPGRRDALRNRLRDLQARGES